MERQFPSEPFSGRDSLRQTSHLDGDSRPSPPFTARPAHHLISTDLGARPDPDGPSDIHAPPYKPSSGAPLNPSVSSHPPSAHPSSLSSFSSSSSSSSSSALTPNMAAKKRKSCEDAVTGSDTATPHLSSATEQSSSSVQKTACDSSDLPSFAQDLDTLKNLASCKVCSRLLYEPYTLLCGHTFCYICLCTWFSTAKTCPECRALVKRCPAPSFLIKELVSLMIDRTELLSPEEYEEHKKFAKEDADVIKSHRDNTDATHGGLFKGAFTQEHLPPVIDEEDGVERCPYCAWELDAGWCVHCDRVITTDPITGIDIDFSHYAEDDDFDSSSNDHNMDDDIGQHIVGSNTDLYGSDLESIVEEMELEDESVVSNYLETIQAQTTASIRLGNLLSRTSRLRQLRAEARYPHHPMNALDEEAEDEGDENEDDFDEEEDGTDSTMEDFIVDDDEVEYEASEHPSSDESEASNASGLPGNGAAEAIDLVSDTSELSPATPQARQSAGQTQAEVIESSSPAHARRQRSRRIRRHVRSSSSSAPETQRRRPIVDSSTSPQPEIQASGPTLFRESSHVSVEDDDDDDDDGPIAFSRRDRGAARRLNSHSQGHPRHSSRFSSARAAGEISFTPEEEYGSEITPRSRPSGVAGVSNCNTLSVSPRSTSNSSRARTAPFSLNSNSGPASTLIAQQADSPPAPAADNRSFNSSDATNNSRSTMRDQFLQQLATMTDIGVASSRISADPRISHLLSQYIGGSFGEADAFAQLDQLGGAPFPRPRTANRSWTPLIPQPPIHRSAPRVVQPSSTDQHGVSLNPRAHVSIDDFDPLEELDRSLDHSFTSPVAPVPLVSHRRVSNSTPVLAATLHHTAPVMSSLDRAQMRPASRLTRSPSISSNRRTLSPPPSQASPHGHSPLSARNASVPSRNPFTLFSNPIIRPVPSTQRLREQSSTTTIRQRESVRSLRTQPPPISVRDRHPEQGAALSGSLTGSSRISGFDGSAPPVNSTSRTTITNPMPVNLTHTAGPTQAYHRRMSRGSLRSQASSHRLAPQPSYQRLAPQPSTRLLRTTVTPVNDASSNTASRPIMLRNHNRPYFDDEERQQRVQELIRGRQQILTNPFLALSQSPLSSLRSFHPSSEPPAASSNVALNPLPATGGSGLNSGSSFQARISRAAPSVVAHGPLARPVYVGVGRQADVH